MWSAISTPAYSFAAFLPPFVRPNLAAAALLALLTFGSLLGLVRSPGAFLSALVVLVGFELFFQLIYPGYYRHEALLLVYLVTLYWLAGEGRGGAWPEHWRLEERLGRAPDFGRILFLLLLALQVVTGAGLVAADLSGVPYSRSRDLADLLKRRHLTDAILIADPDTLLETVSYYLPNPTYLMREQKLGHVVRFTRHVRRDLSVDDYLRDARLLQARTGRPVVILFQRHIDEAKGPFSIAEVYIWTFSGDPEQVRRFQAATRRIARFGPAITDESYDVYLLDRPQQPGAAAGSAR